MTDPSSGPRLANCEQCGRVIEEESRYCQYCGYEKPGEETKVVEERRRVQIETPLLPVAGGLLIIISSMLLFYTVWVSRSGPPGEGVSSWFLGVIYSWPVWYQTLMVVSGIMGVIGGLSAIFKRSQVIALIGAGLSGLGIGAPLGLIGLLLVAMSEHQFDSELADFTMPVETIKTRRIEGIEYERRM